MSSLLSCYFSTWAKRLNAGLTCSLRGLPLGPGRSLHLLCIVTKAKVLWSIFLSLSEGNLKKVVSLMKLECAILQLQHGNMGKCNCVCNRPCKCHELKTVFSDVY